MQISQYLTPVHRECDNIFARAEKLIADGNFEEGKEEFLKFADETLLHFKEEEEELFPAFEEATGSNDGPTAVMKYEHEQVRNLLGKMAIAIDNKDVDAFLSLAESMMILLQQHNMKEEQMLYAMCDRVFDANRKDEIIKKMQEVKLD